MYRRTLQFTTPQLVATRVGLLLSTRSHRSHDYTMVNRSLGHKKGENLLRNYRSGTELDAKDSVKTMLVESAGSLVFSSAVAICTTGAPTDGCGFLDQMYYNFAFNAVGASFYGIICAIAPLMFLPVIWRKKNLWDYIIQDTNNLRGLGAPVDCVVMSAVETVTACDLFGWAVFGRTMGIYFSMGGRTFLIHRYY